MSRMPKVVEAPVRLVKVEPAVVAPTPRPSPPPQPSVKPKSSRSSERSDVDEFDMDDDDGGNWHVGQNFMYTGEDRATPNGTVFGEITFPDSDPQSRESYVGELYRQKPHGNGILRWRRGNYVRFDGEFKQGAMQCGVLYFGPRGLSRYNGQLSQSRAEGMGDLAPDISDDGLLQYYSGNWRNGLKSGVGVAQFRNGDVYEGEWRSNKMHGQGRYTWRDGTSFSGCFREDEMNGPGVCEWTNDRQLPLSFSHQYPSHLRSGVRILCGILLILTIVYVIPHLFDVGAGSAPSSSDPDFSFESSATVGVAAHSPVGSQNEVLRWKPSHGSLLPASDGPRLAAELGRLLAWPWAWLWPCHFFPPSLDDVAPFPPSRFGKDFDVHLTHPRSFGCSTRACRELCVDEELCAVAPLSSSPAPKGAGMGLLQVRLYQCGLVYGTTPASTWREHGLLPQRDTRTSCSPRPKEPPKPSLWSLVSAYIKLHFKRQLHYLRLGVVILFTLTGDLEDVICAVLWPLFCAICRLPLLGIGPLKAIPDSAVMWSSLSLTLAFACVLCYGVLIVFPESLAELLRVACGSI